MVSNRLEFFLLNTGGYNIRQLDPVWFRKHIGLVNQEPVLFASSIADNIAYGRDDATSDEVRKDVVYCILCTVLQYLID